MSIKKPLRTYTVQCISVTKDKGVDGCQFSRNFVYVTHEWPRMAENCSGCAKELTVDKVFCNIF